MAHYLVHDGISDQSTFLGFDGVADTFEVEQAESFLIRLIGGTGNDLYLIEESLGNFGEYIRITENAGGGIDTLRFVAEPASNYSIVLQDNLENLVFLSEEGYGTISGNDAANVLSTAGGADDTIYGGLGNDTISTGAGDDNLDGEGGVDSMSGGSGGDLYFVDASGDVVVELAGGGDDDYVESSVSYVLPANVEGLELSGSGNINGTGNASGNYIRGNTGRNSLSGLAGDDELEGGEGNDTLMGGVGADTLDGGTGNDTLQGEAGNDELYGQDGTDLLDGGEGDDYIDGSDDTSTDTLVGGAGNDEIDGLDGDLINAGAGDDLIEYAADLALSASIDGGAGEDTLFLENDGGFPAFTMHGSLENLNLDGNAMDITGNALNNYIEGAGGNDILRGGAGADVLFGEGGSNTLFGGAGNDSYLVYEDDTVVELLAADGAADTVYAMTNSWVLGANVEHLVFGGTTSDPEDDHFFGRGNALNNSITGSGDEDARNTLIGMAGNDTLDALGGEGILIGGTGNDTYRTDRITAYTMVDDFDDWSEMRIIELANEGMADTVIYTGNDTFRLGSNLENLTLTRSESGGVGNGLNNVITGSAGEQWLDGGRGNDTLAGGAGDDEYSVDSTLDVVTELVGGGDDVIYSSVSLTLGANVEGLELLESGRINGTGNTLDNEIRGNSSANTLTGAAGNDYLDGYRGADTLNGNDGNDTLDGGAGADLMSGGNGNDLYYVTQSSDLVVETGTGVDEVISTISYELTDVDLEHLTLAGSAITGTGNTLGNRITGTGSNNTLVGLGGNDTLDGGTGADLMNGGAGNDTYTVDNAGDVVTDADGGNADLVITGLGSYTLGATIENLTLLTGSEGGTGNALSNRIIGNDMAGGENLYGLVGNDTLLGNAGGDLLEGAEGNDSLDGGSGDDDIYGGDNNDTLLGGTGNDELYGDTGNDSLSGDAGNDSLYGGAGNDTMAGGAGNDRYDVDVATDVVTELANGGNDTIVSSINYSIATLANVENLSLGGPATTGTGNAGNNGLVGNTGDNTLSGGGGNDTLSGMDGNDSLLGEAGNDSLIGGGNNDALVGGEGNDTLDGGGGVDSYTGGNGDDVYQYLGGVINADSGGNDVVTLFTQYDSGADFNAGTLGIEVVHADFGGTITILANAANVNNLFDGEFGNSSYIMDGGLGNDTMSVFSGAGGNNHTITGGAGADLLLVTAESGPSGNNFTLDGVETVEISGSGSLFFFDDEATDVVTYVVEDYITGFGEVLSIGSDAPDEGENVNLRLGNGADFHLEVGEGIDTLTIQSSAPDDVNEIAVDANGHAVKITGDASLSVILEESDTIELENFNAEYIAFGEGENADFPLVLNLTLDNVNTELDVDSFNGEGDNFVEINLTVEGDSEILLYSDLDEFGSQDITITGGEDLVLNIFSMNEATIDASGLEGDLALDLVLNSYGLVGGNGDLTIILGTGNDTVYSGEGSDTIDFSTNANRLTYDDAVYGGEGIDSLTAEIHGVTYEVEPTRTFTIQSVEEITLDAGESQTTMRLDLSGVMQTTDDGQVTVYLTNGFGGNAGKWTIEGLGHVNLNASGSDMSLEVVDFDLGGRVITGSDFNDVIQAAEDVNDSVTLIGGGGNDIIAGGGYGDTLTGGLGNDTVTGGLGSDALTGNAGSDAFRFTDSTSIDTIQDFVSGTDDILLETTAFAGPALGVLSASNFSDVENGTAQDTDDYILYDTTTGNLYYDADGSGAGARVQFATIAGGGAGSVVASDFTVVSS